MGDWFVAAYILIWDKNYAGVQIECARLFVWKGASVMGAISDRARLYKIMGELRARLGCVRRRECNGRMNWPKQGVYFFFESGELRSDGLTPRVVRVGTHAVSKNSHTTLWSRLSNHQGTVKSKGGNHRGSVFRKHLGSALLALDDRLQLDPNT